MSPARAAPTKISYAAGLQSPYWRVLGTELAFAELRLAHHERRKDSKAFAIRKLRSTSWPSYHHPKVFGACANSPVAILIGSKTIKLGDSDIIRAPFHGFESKQHFAKHPRVRSLLAASWSCLIHDILDPQYTSCHGSGLDLNGHFFPDFAEELSYHIVSSVKIPACQRAC